MKIIKRTALLLLVMLTAIGCSGGDDDESVPAEDWCESLWDEGLAPTDWDHARFTRDCLEGLEAGFTRDDTREIYEAIKAEGG